MSRGENPGEGVGKALKDVNQNSAVAFSFGLFSGPLPVARNWARMQDV